MSDNTFDSCLGQFLLEQKPEKPASYTHLNLALR
jgi:hypothetical protein